MIDYYQLFDDICQGHSRMKYSESSFVYIKHLTPSDTRNSIDYYEECLSDLISRGVETEEEILKRAIHIGSWTKEEEYIKIKKEIERIEETIPKLENRIALVYQNNLEKSKIKESELFAERELAVGQSAENFAKREQNSQMIYGFFFKDKKLHRKMFNNPGEESEEDFFQAFSVFIEYQKMFNLTNIKKLALENFFQIYYPYVNSSQEFFGVPAYKMTINQSNLLYYAYLFKNILQNSDVPEHIHNDPEAILSWNKSEYAKNKKENKKSKREPPSSSNKAERITYSYEDIISGALDRKP